MNTNTPSHLCTHPLTPWQEQKALIKIKDLFLLITLSLKPYPALTYTHRGENSLGWGYFWTQDQGFLREFLYGVWVQDWD